MSEIGCQPLPVPDADAAGSASCAFVILAHQKPDQVLRLIDRLSGAPIFLHVDLGADPTVHPRLVEGVAGRSSVRLLPRRRSKWAGWGLVEAPLIGIRAAHGVGAQHVAVLSGQDYPLVPAGELQSFSRRYAGVSFLAHWRLPSDVWGPSGGMERLRYWHLPIRGRRFRVPVARRIPPAITPYGGSAYSLLARPAIEDLLHFLDDRPDVARFYRHAWMPEEMFIPTALMNSGSRAEIVNENLWYMEWKPGAKHPKTFGVGDAEALLAAGGRESATGGTARAKLFGRKFDADADSEILDVLDARRVLT